MSSDSVHLNKKNVCVQCLVHTKLLLYYCVKQMEQQFLLQEYGLMNRAIIKV